MAKNKPTKPVEVTPTAPTDTAPTDTTVNDAGSAPIAPVVAPTDAKPEKETKPPKEPKPAKIVQNNTVRPGVGTKTGRVWEIADAISRANKAPAGRADVLKQGEAEGINKATIATQYGLWRVFNGLTGENAPKKVAPIAVAPVAPVEPVQVGADPVTPTDDLPVFPDDTGPEGSNGD